MAAVAAADVTFEVSLLSGNTASITCAPDASLGSLQREIADKLGLLKGDAWPSLLFFPSSGEGTPFQETLEAKELADQSITAGVHAEPEWCTNICFKKSWIRGRRCGMEEDSEDVVLKLHAGGNFSYSVKYHSHDAECGYNSDQSIDAAGTWRLSRRALKDGDLEEVICLEGSATHKTVETHTRGMYDYDDYNDNSSDSASNDDEDDSDPEPVVAPPGATMPASRNKNETVTEKFNMSFTKADLLSADTGRHSRGGWTKTELPPQKPEDAETGGAAGSSG